MDLINLHSIERNRSTLYLLPSIDFQTNDFTLKLIEAMGFINVYLDWKECPVKYKEDILFFLFNPGETALNEWVKFIEICKEEPNYVECHTLDVNVFMLVFKVSKKYDPIIKPFKNGKYSEIDKSYVKLFGKSHQVYAICNKLARYRKVLEEDLDVEISDDIELDSIPDMKKEIFKYEK